MAAIRPVATCASRLPVIVILGATGSGKSKLALQLSSHVNSEIISADSMQVYKGLDIITNKVTAEEQAQCPHHLISVLDPLHMQHTVQDFQESALPLIDRLLECKKSPIIVGGTNYYIEALLWEFLLKTKKEGGGKCKTSTDLTDVVKAVHVTSSPCMDYNTLNDRNLHPAAANSPQHASTSDDVSEDDIHSSFNENCQQNREAVSIDEQKRLQKEGRYYGTETSRLHRQLWEVDIDSAKRLHPNERRKIIRALEVYDQSGVAMSRHYTAQHHGIGELAISGNLRYKNPCILWVQCEKAVLNVRLDTRVDDMMTRGLLAELEHFHRHYNSLRMQQGKPPDYTLGIFQSIGFKEFHKYLVLAQELKDTAPGRQLFQKCVEELKLATRRYAIKQTRWIQNRFINRPDPNGPRVYGLDGTGLADWDSNVLQPALSIVQAFLQCDPSPVDPLPAGEMNDRNAIVHETCHACGGRIFVRKFEWELHMKSNKHKKMVARQARLARLAAEMAKELSKDQETEKLECNENDDQKDSQTDGSLDNS